MLGTEWSPEGDPSGMAALIASEAQAITLAAEGLLGVIFTVATLTDEAVGSEEEVGCHFIFAGVLFYFFARTKSLAVEACP